MKRSAASLVSNDNMGPIPKRSKRTNDALPSREHSSRPFQLAGKDHILVARLQVKCDPEHSCVKRIHAIFTLRAVGQTGKPAGIGHMYGQTIDRKLTSDYRPDQTPFVFEMLNNRSASEQVDRPMEHSTKKENDETELIMQHIFHPDGTPREDFSRKCLRERARLHFIAAFELDPAHRGCGLAKLAMHTYLRGIQKLDGCHKFRGTVLLSPAALPQKKETYAKGSPSGPMKSLVQIEHALIASYERAGFKVWSKGDDDLGGRAITIMGLRLTGPKITRVSTVPLAPTSTDHAEETVRCLSQRVDSAL